MRSQRIIKRRTHRKNSSKKTHRRNRRNRRNRKIRRTRRTRRRSIKQNGGMFDFGWGSSVGEDGGGARSGTREYTFLEKIKNTLKTLTSSEWSEESLPIGQQWCGGNNEYFYQCYLDKLIGSLRELNLKKDKFFWVDGVGHSYIIYDEGGEIGNYINISPNNSVENQPCHTENPEDWDRRIIIDKSQNFIGYVKDGFKPIETWGATSHMIYYDGVTRMKFSGTMLIDSGTTDCSKPFHCKR